ncbi:hypothetical protein [Listeria booriae]|uniref:hypothetical protein n=1 Tax=Listeria booriae TaxID=1552123 RepID=UPI0016291B79|nr:hypothetical protein [Listeria booriae]MBC2196283.1 hypothetical protein [Listeria booriae]
MSKLLMEKTLSDGKKATFKKNKDGTYSYQVYSERPIPISKKFNSLYDAIENFKNEHRDCTDDELTSEEQFLIDQFNNWDGNLKEMGSI